MKIEVKGEQVVLTSTNSTEKAQLTQVFVASLNPVKRQYKKRKVNPYKGKHKKACAVCGKKYKNIKLHEYKKHSISPLTLA